MICFGLSGSASGRIALVKVKKVGYYPLQIRIISADNHNLKDVLVGEDSFASAVLRSSGAGSSGSGPAKGNPKALL